MMVLVTYPTSETCEDAIAMESSATGYFGHQAWYSVSFDTPQFVTASVVGSYSYVSELNFIFMQAVEILLLLLEF